MRLPFMVLVLLVDDDREFHTLYPERHAKGGVGCIRNRRVIIVCAYGLRDGNIRNIDDPETDPAACSPQLILKTEGHGGVEPGG